MEVGRGKVGNPAVCGRVWLQAGVLLGVQEQSAPLMPFYALRHLIYIQCTCLYHGRRSTAWLTHRGPKTYLCFGFFSTI